MEDLDPIEELREIRRKIVAQAGGTPAALMRYLRSLEKKENQKSPLCAVNALARKISRRRKTPVS